MNLSLPRTIIPESAEVGDKIRVRFPEVDGVIVERVGVVHRRIDTGPARTLYTEEGGSLCVWWPGRSGLVVTLLDRPPQEQPPLSIFEHIERRIHA